MNGNIYHNAKNPIKLLLNYDEYWDLYLNSDCASMPIDYGKRYDDCLISYIDSSLKYCVKGEWLYGFPDYLWRDYVSIDYTLENIGYTGVDNGLFKYRKDMITNYRFTKTYKNNWFEIYEDEPMLKLHQVSGNTMKYEYPIEISDGVIKLMGGFYQGFYRTECGKYSILPNELDDVWNFEFVLKREDFEGLSEKKILNNSHPNNKGLFFYMGTRSENKWVEIYKEGHDECNDTFSPDDYVEDSYVSKKSYIIGNFSNVNPDFDEESNDFDDYFDYDSNLSENGIVGKKDERKCCYQAENAVKIHSKKCNISCSDEFGGDYILDDDSIDPFETDYLEDELDLTDFVYETDKGFNIREANQYGFKTDNKFLLFDRTCNGYNVHNWDEESEAYYFGIKSKFSGNLFLLMNRTCSGYTVDNIDEFRKKDDYKYNVYADLYDNAIGFRITDSGAIGYRMITKDCEKEEENKVKVLEGYSYDGVIPYKEWVQVDVKMYGGARTMKIQFYVNGNLVYITNDLPKVRFRKLDEPYDKQEGIPFNISLGGGSQGLCDTIQPNYMLLPDKTYPIEENFAGSFIGWFKSFKFYTCSVGVSDMKNNFSIDRKQVI